MPYKHNDFSWTFAFFKGKTLFPLPDTEVMVFPAEGFLLCFDIVIYMRTSHVVTLHLQINCKILTSLELLLHKIP